MSYDGTAYSGYQRQKNGPSVQEALETALTAVVGESVRVVAAGRTDAGVHASGQVIAFDTQWRHECRALRIAANIELPADIALRQVEDVPLSFQPRFDALERTYQYRTFFDKVRDPLRERFEWRIDRQIELAAINKAIRLSLIGKRDFSAFGHSPSGDNTVRHIVNASWSSVAAGAYLFEITANAFLNRMVRRIVGTLYEVGQGRIAPAQFEEMIILGARKDTSLAPPQGLTLTSVTYGEK